MTTPIKPDFEDLSAVAHDETPILTELRFPSPQRGRGVRGEGDHELVGICHLCHIQPPSLENPIQRGSGAQHRGGTVSSSNVAPRGGMKTSLALEAEMTRRVTPPHPQPLSHVGERGAEGSVLRPIKSRLADASTRARKVRANDLGGLFVHASLRTKPGSSGSIEESRHTNWATGISESWVCSCYRCSYGTP